MTHTMSQLIAYPIESFLVQRLASTFQKYNNGLVPLKMRNKAVV